MKRVGEFSSNPTGVLAGAENLDTPGMGTEERPSEDTERRRPLVS